MKHIWKVIILFIAIIGLVACADNKPATNNKEASNKDHTSIDQNSEKQNQEKDTPTKEKSTMEIPESNIVYGPSNPNYKMNFTYKREDQTLEGDMEVTFTNNVKDNLNKLYFDLWPNADTFQKTGGKIEVSDVKVNDQTATFKVNKTHLEISNLALKKDAQATVSMDVKVSIPQGEDRFGWNGTTVSLGNWFPILGVYDDEGWNIDPYFTYGESFYSLTGNFDVNITTEPNEVLVATGKEIDKNEHDGMVTHHYKAANVRDFAMEMDPTYQLKQTTVDGIDVNVYYTKELEQYADIMLKSGKDSIKLYDEKFGKYPWPELDVVSMKGWFGGMEYPQLVMISFQNQQMRPDWVRMVVAHEIGHQWFYGVVGDNEYDEPWLDESFATFAAALLMGNLDQYKYTSLEGTDFHLTSPVSGFPNDTDGGRSYYNTIYNYGEKTLNDLRLLVGDDVFYKTIQNYYLEKKFKVTTTADFMRAFMKASDKDLTAFFKEHRMYPSEK